MIKKTILLIIILLFASSCATKQVVKEVPIEVQKVSIQHDTLIKTVNSIKFDSIFCKDTMWLTALPDGTKVINNLSIKEKYSKVGNADTIYKNLVRIDTIPKIIKVTETQIVKQEYKGFLYYLGYILFLLTSISSIILYVRYKLKGTLF